MAIEVRMVDDIMHVRLHGALTSEDLLVLGNEVLAIEHAMAVPPSRITDMTGLESLQIAFPEIHALAERRRTMPLAAPIKSAIVAGTDVQYGMARMYQTLNDHPEITLEIFRDRAAALEWLARSDARIK